MGQEGVFKGMGVVASVLLVILEKSELAKNRMEKKLAMVLSSGKQDGKGLISQFSILLLVCSLVQLVSKFTIFTDFNWF